ncbi:hypothetical protein CBS101457_005712 [Exobasidium rhododendri]|nr:hypothetical protein CBS101457_005712 [Exobasidium rhododendri]
MVRRTQMQSAALLLLSTLIASCSGLNQPSASADVTPSILTSDPGLLREYTYDYIVVGGGLSGMVLASRLSEDPEKNVLLIEAGNDTRKDRRVRTLRLDTESLWWNVQSQEQIDGTIRNHSLGIGLGGSTTVNGAKVDGPQAGQLDAFRAFGNPSWSWDRVLSYMKKSQNYQAPIESASKYGATYDKDGHGVHGPVDISHSPHSYTGLPQTKFIEALNHTLKVDKIIDAATGEGNGYSYCPHFVKHGSHNTRESSATAYFDPIEFERSNLHILTSWRGVRVNWEKKNPLSSSTSFWSALQQPFGPSSKAVHRATSVTVQRKVNGATFDMPLSTSGGKGNSEIILSSGALITPLILELSGVGDAAVLSKIGVKRLVDLPGVGRNFIEKPTNIVRNQGRNTSRVEVSGAPLPAVAMLSIDKVMQNSSDVLRTIEEGMQTWAEEAVAAGGAVNLQGITKQYEVMKKGIFEEKWPVSEWEYFSKDEVAIKTFALLPWSRGYIHSTTNNSVWNQELSDVELNARFWTRGLDMDIQVQALRRARELLATPLMKVVSKEELYPGTTLIANTAEFGDYADWRKYIIATYEGIHHNMGTAAMMSRELGGVVNEEFQVYGTSNLRVVDASIFPLQISAHPAATLFGIAEMAADLIRS